MISAAIQNVHTSYPDKAERLVLAPISNRQIKLTSIRCLNRSGLTCDVGFLKKLAEQSRKIFYFDGAAATEITSQIDSNVSSIIGDAAAGAGFIIQSKVKFNLIGLNISVAQTGAPVATVEYFNGTVWVAITDLIEVVDLSNPGYSLIMFSSPLDIAVGAPFAGMDPNMYAVRVTFAAGGNSPEADSLIVGSFIDFSSAVLNNAAFQTNFEVEYPFVLEANEGIIPYFGSANVKNLVTAYYSQGN